MQSRISQFLTRLALLAAVFLMASCGGGPDRSAPPPTTRKVPAEPTAPPAPTIDLSRPIPGGSLHGTPRPPLENTGTAYVAITRSLIANFRWLTENPDPALISELYVPGTEAHDYWVPAYGELVSKTWHFADDNYVLLSASVVDTTANAVTLRVVDSMDFERIVDSSGSQVGSGRPREPRVKTWILLLTSDAEGRWRFADWSRIDQEIEL